MNKKEQAAKVDQLTHDTSTLLKSIRDALLTFIAETGEMPIQTVLVFSDCDDEKGGMTSLFGCNNPLHAIVTLSEAINTIASTHSHPAPELVDLPTDTKAH